MRLIITKQNLISQQNLWNMPDQNHIGTMRTLENIIYIYILDRCIAEIKLAQYLKKKFIKT